jgi:hypothetical protein
MRSHWTGKAGGNLRWVLGAAAIFFATEPVFAQGRGGATTGTSGGIGAGSRVGGTTGGVGSTTGGIGATGGGQGSTIGGLGGAAGGAGQTGGGGFTGGAGGAMGFTGGTGMAGGAGAGAQGAMSGRGGLTGAVVVPVSTNTFVRWFANPYALGLTATGTTSKPFGQPTLYANVNTTGLGTGQLGGGRTGTTATQETSGFTTIGIPRAPAYVTVLSEDTPLVTYSPTKLQVDLRAFIDRSSTLRSKKNIQVEVVESTVILRGTVADERERRLAEGMIRLTPGVRDVQNELVIASASAAAKPK